VNRTIHDFDSVERERAIAAFTAEHKNRPDFGIPADRAWMEGWMTAQAEPIDDSYSSGYNADLAEAKRECGDGCKGCPRCSDADKIIVLLRERFEADMEQGVAWMNDAASKEFAKKYPRLLASIQDINRYLSAKDDHEEG
jgi:hypothetical protein